MRQGLPSRDWLTPSGADDLARRIEAYWKKRGRAVKVRSLANYETGNGACHVNGPVAVVRSNMAGGWPPKDIAAPVFMGFPIMSRRGETPKTSHLLVRR